jgi:RHS repeat-associated protein
LGPASLRAAVRVHDPGAIVSSSGLSLRKLSASQGAASWRLDYLTDEEDRPYGAVYRSPASSTSPLYFTIVTNDRGDVLALADADGAVFAAYRYDAWGAPQGAGNLATGIWTQATSLITANQAGQIATRQILRYASYAYDTESGFYYCSARYYDPATRQWTSADPAKADGEGSAYLYCGGEPVGMVDPAGLWAWRWLEVRRGWFTRSQCLSIARTEGGIQKFKAVVSIISFARSSPHGTVFWAWQAMKNSSNQYYLSRYSRWGGAWMTVEYYGARWNWPMGRWRIIEPFSGRAHTLYAW